MTLRVALVGYGRHARRISDIVDASGVARVDVVYHPTTHVQHRGATCSYDDVTSCDAVVVASATHAHCENMRMLRAAGYRGYVLCEKPPFADAASLDEFAAYRPKVMYDFNMRFGAFCGLFSLGEEYGLGRLVSVDVEACHGFAYSPAYVSSWRSDIARHPLGVVETVAVHWFDLVSYMLGVPIECVSAVGRTVSGVGDAYDTASLTFTCDDVVVGVSASYATATSMRVRLTHTHGFVELSDAVGLRVSRQPLDTQFTRPVVVHSAEVDFEKVYEDSLSQSVSAFLGVANTMGEFDPRGYECSISSNYTLLDIGTKLRKLHFDPCKAPVGLI